ncbi:MAG: diacylglycerol kinase family protein [Oscillospiraceae bacterium]|nr:diacylglycerol kinase family protein [Oscillospiraceae bacterium]
MNYVFLLNYFAERKKATELELAIRDLEVPNGAKVEIHRTEYPGHAGELAADAARRYQSDAIVFACGGDGTVHEVANALAFGQTPMSVLPMGTGNDFARTVLPELYYNEPSKVIEAIENFEIRPVDLIRVDCYDELSNFLPDKSRYSVNITSFGLDTMVNAQAKEYIRKTNRNSFVRKNAYTIAILKCFIKGWDFQMKYSFELAGGKETAQGQMKFSLACICNGRYYGGGFNPSPQSLTDDGVLEVCLVEDLPRRKAIPLVGKYKKGKHLGNPLVSFYKVTSGVISSVDRNAQIHGNYDGEDFFAHQVRFEVIPDALPFAFFSI